MPARHTQSISSIHVPVHVPPIVLSPGIRTPLTRGMCRHTCHVSPRAHRGGDEHVLQEALGVVVRDRFDLRDTCPSIRRHVPKHTVTRAQTYADM